MDAELGQNGQRADNQAAPIIETIQEAAIEAEEEESCAGDDRNTRKPTSIESGSK